MKAIVAEPPEKKTVKLIDISKPVPRKGQVLLKTLCVGIDGTDREINEGLYGTPPSNSQYLILGHEAVTTIQTIDNQVYGFSEGDLVVPTVRRPCLENCLNCRGGEVDMCLTGNYFEHGIYRLHGFAAEYSVTDPNFLVKIPQELENVAVLLEPLSIAEKGIAQIFNIQKRMAWEPKRAFIAGAGTLGLLAAMVLRLRGFEVYVAATRTKESLKAKIVDSVGGNYVNVRDTPIRTLQSEFDVIIEATGSVEVALEALSLLGPNGVFCLLGIYREKRACEEFGNVLTNMVLGNRLVFGSVNSNTTHFQLGVQDLKEIKRRYGNVLERMITEKLHPSGFEQAFNSEKEGIKTVIYF